MFPFWLLTQVQTELGSLSSTVSGLSTALATLQSSVDGIEAPTDYSSDQATLASGLATSQTSIDSLTAQLENFDGNDAQLNTISSTLAQVAADVKELLGNNAVVNSDIIITNTAQLVLAESLVDTRTDAPNIIVNGEVRVEFNNTNLTADEKTRAQAVLNKIATIVGHDLSLTNSASPATAIALPNLTFVDGNVSINTNDASLPKLLSVSNDFTVDYSGAINYPTLASVGNDFTISPAKLGAITSIDLSGVTIAGDLMANGPGMVNLPKATTANFGTASVVSTTLAIATDIDLGHTDDLASLYISAPKADTIDIATDEIMGTLQILGTDDTVVINLPNLTAVGATTIEDSAKLNLNKLTGFDGTALIDSDAVNIPELSTNVTGTLTFTEATTLNFPKLTLAGMLDGQKAETLTFKSGVDTNLTTTNKAKSITIVEQGNTTNFDASTQTILETLNVTGKANTAPSSTTVTSMITAVGAKLKTVVVAGLLDDVEVGGAEVISVTTTGKIRSFTLDTTAKLTSAAIGHDHISGSGAATLNISNNAKLTSVDLSSVSDVGNLTIQGNTELTSFVSPNKDVRVEPTAAVNVVVSGNKLAGVYTRGKAAIPGTPTTPAVPAVESIINQSSIYGLRLWIEAHFVNTASPTWQIDIEAFDDDSDADTTANNGDYDAVVAADANNGVDDGANQIDIYAELKTVKQ